MIITVGSEFTDNSDANDFVNHFPSGLIIKPGSKIGLLNCTYNIDQGLVVTAGIDDTFQYSFPPFNNLLTITIPPGQYTLATLATAFRNALRTAQINEAATNPETAGLIQTSGIHVNHNETNNTIRLLVVYNPVSINETISISNGADPNTFITGTISGGIPPATGTNKGFYFKSGSQDTYASNRIVTSDGNANKFESYAFGLIEPKDANKFYHVTSFKVGQRNAEMAVALATNTTNDPKTMPFGIQCLANGTFKIFEKIGGVVTDLTLAGGTDTYAIGDTFQIYMPYQTEGVTRYPVYFQKEASTGRTDLVDVSSSPARGRVDLNADFTPMASIKTGQNLGQLEQATNILSKAGGLLSQDAVNITTPGTGYYDREVCSISGGSGDGNATVIIRTDTNGNLIETPTSFSFMDRGSGYANTDVLTLTGKVSGASNARLTVDGNGIFGYAAMSNGGTGYQTGDVITDQGGGNIELTVVSVDDPSTGVITEASITKGTTGSAGDVYAFNTVKTFSNFQGGTNAQFSFRQVIQQKPFLSEFSFRGLVKNPTFHPLQQVQFQQWRATSNQSFAPLIGFPVSQDGPGPSGNLEINGDKIINNNRTANNMLIHLDSFPLSSRHIGGEGRCVMALPFGSIDNTQTGLFSDRNFNLTYHSLENKQDENHNMMRVRITDARGNKLQGIKHPVIINFDLRPKSL